MMKRLIALAAALATAGLLAACGGSTIHGIAAGHTGAARTSSTPASSSTRVAPCDNPSISATDKQSMGCNDPEPTGNPCDQPNVTCTTSTPSTPAPATTAANPTLKPLTFSGTSDDVLQINTGETSDPGRLVTATYHGSGNFVVEALDANGEEVSLPVNTIGTYRGTTLLLPPDGTTVMMLKVTADGPWTVKLADVRTGTKWAGTNPASGVGDTVLIIPGLTRSAETVTITNQGQDNFVVRSYSDEESLLANEIGDWSGVEVLPAQTALVEVISDGKWSITPS